jgi:hypothetical protein
MATKKAKKHPKMDPYRVSNQQWEIQYVASKFGVKTDLIRKLKKQIKTSSRQKLYSEIRRVKRDRATS